MADEDIKEVELTPTDLDAIHERNLRELDEEQQEPQAPEDEPIPEEPKQDEEPTVPTPQPEPEVPGEVKEEPVIVPSDEQEVQTVKIKDSAGEIQEFKSLSDLPDDFEPYSYKDLAVGVAELTELGIESKRKTAEAEQIRQNKEEIARIDAIKAGWDKEIADLVEEGRMAKDEDDRVKTISGVYDLMIKERDAGHPINSLRQAFELYEYRNNIQGKQAEKAAKDAEKKKRGSKVQASGIAPTKSGSGGGKTLEAPPTGLSLDQVHERVLGSL